MKLLKYIQKTVLALAAAGTLSSPSLQADTIEVTSNIPAGTNVVWSATNVYLLRRVIYVETNATLTIEPGTVIKASTTNVLATTGIPNLTAALWVTRGAKLFAEGTATQPIIFTVEEDDVNNPNDLPLYTNGLWGGVVLCGNAVINTAQDPTGNTATPKYEVFEGTTGALAVNMFGGTNDLDSSGVVRYVSIRYPGTVFAPNRELNGLTLGAVGSGTKIENVEVFGSSDDGFEWFGGNVNSRYLVAAFCTDDSFDTDQGYRGDNQFWFAIQQPSADKGMEIDGDLIQGTVTNLPISRWFARNVTLIGRGVGTGQALNPRDDAAPNLANSVFTEWGQGMFIENDGMHFFTTNVLGGFSNNVWNVSAGVAGANGAFFFTDTNYVNQITNPNLVSVSRTNNYGLDPRPTAGSIVFSNVLAFPGDGFYQPTTYRGAFGNTFNWADWTALSDLGVFGTNGLLPKPIALTEAPQFSAVQQSSTNVLVVYPTELGSYYQIQSTTNLAFPTSWTELLRRKGTGSTITNSFPADPNVKAFYRVRLVAY